MEEIWKDIYDYENLYQISNMGRVRNIKYGRFLKPNNRRYYDVDLSKNGVHKRQAIHRLVALHFVPNPNPKGFDTVNHKDGNPHNNVYYNLEWTSNYQNLVHASRELKKNIFGKPSRPVVKLSMDGEKIEEFNSIAEAGRSIGIKGANIHISECCRNVVNSAYGYKWQYLKEN